MGEGLGAIRNLLTTIRPLTIADQSLPQAAVLMPFFDAGSDPYLLFTKRTETVRHHKGQISFPGGARDGTEPLEVTAVRETEEEIGILPSQVELLGRFHEYVSSSNYRVTPFVALVAPDLRLMPNPAEVAYVLHVPLRFFAEHEPECRVLERRGQRMPVYFYDYQGEVIWGLTARIVKDFVDLLIADR